MDLLVDRLERAYTPIHTIGFLNLGVAGEWDFRYTTSNLPGHDPRKLRLRSVAQRVAPGEEKVQAGKLTNTIAWELVEEGASGTMEIKCDYMVTPKVRPDGPAVSKVVTELTVVMVTVVALVDWGWQQLEFTVQYKRITSHFTPAA